MTIREWDEMRLLRDIDYAVKRGEVIYTTKDGEEIRGGSGHHPFHESLAQRTRRINVKHKGAPPVGRPPSRGARKPDLGTQESRQRAEPEFLSALPRPCYTGAYEAELTHRARLARTARKPDLEAQEGGPDA